MGPRINFTGMTSSAFMVSTESINQSGEARNTAGGVGVVDHPLGSRRIDYWYGCCKGFLGNGDIFPRNSFTDMLYKSPQGGADMLVSQVFLFVLPVSFQGRLVVRQTAPPVYGEIVELVLKVT